MLRYAKKNWFDVQYPEQPLGLYDVGCAGGRMIVLAVGLGLVERAAGVELAGKPLRATRNGVGPLEANGLEFKFKQIVEETGMQDFANARFGTDVMSLRRFDVHPRVNAHKIVYLYFEAQCETALMHAYHVIAQDVGVKAVVTCGHKANKTKLRTSEQVLGVLGKKWMLLREDTAVRAVGGAEKTFWTFVRRIVQVSCESSESSARPGSETDPVFG